MQLTKYEVLIFIDVKILFPTKIYVLDLVANSLLRDYDIDFSDNLDGDIDNIITAYKNSNVIINDPHGLCKLTGKYNSNKGFVDNRQILNW